MRRKRQNRLTFSSGDPDLNHRSRTKTGTKSSLQNVKSSRNISKNNKPRANFIPDLRHFSKNLNSNLYLCWKKFKSKFSSSRIPSLEDPVLCSMSEYICILFSLSFSEKTLKFEDTENEGNLIGGPLTSITGKLVSLPELILYLNGLSVVVEGLHEANLK